MSLEPVPDDLVAASRAYRRTLGTFATGVCVMTAWTPEGGVGLTANSFSSVSLDPRLILWSIARDSERHSAFVSAERFGVQVLRADDQARAERFAFGDARLAADDLTEAEGAPRLRDVLARLECLAHERHEVGDHTVIIGRVVEFHSEQGAALTYFRGGFGRLNLEEEGA
jgi:3-hydroxy-9,10-secoandrosta-1,3,5(10)-triene-9,17-dione monooxygenase reductase component